MHIKPQSNLLIINLHYCVILCYFTCKKNLQKPLITAVGQQPHLLLGPEFAASFELNHSFQR